jgi:hypothetical protein
VASSPPERKTATKTLTLSLIAQGAPKTHTGVITDTMCGAGHTHMGVRSCNGKWKYALLGADKKMYVLSDQQTPERFAARKVKVTGTLYEKTGVLKVAKIEPAN